jgi:hypothetical protein
MAPQLLLDCGASSSSSLSAAAAALSLSFTSRQGFAYSYSSSSCTCRPCRRSSSAAASWSPCPAPPRLLDVTRLLPDRSSREACSSPTVKSPCRTRTWLVPCHRAGQLLASVPFHSIPRRPPRAPAAPWFVHRRRQRAPRRAKNAPPHAFCKPCRRTPEPWPALSGDSDWLVGWLAGCRSYIRRAVRGGASACCRGAAVAAATLHRPAHGPPHLDGRGLTPCLPLRRPAPTVSGQLHVHRCASQALDGKHTIINRRRSFRRRVRLVGGRCRGIIFAKVCV